MPVAVAPDLQVDELGQSQSAEHSDAPLPQWIVDDLAGIVDDHCGAILRGEYGPVREFRGIGITRPREAIQASLTLSARDIASGFPPVSLADIWTLSKAKRISMLCGDLN